MRNPSDIPFLRCDVPARYLQAPAVMIPAGFMPGKTSTLAPARVVKCTITFQQEFCDVFPSQKPSVCSWHKLKKKGHGHVDFHQLNCPWLVEEELPISSSDLIGWHYQANSSPCYSPIRLNNPTSYERSLRIGCICQDGAIERLMCAFDLQEEGNLDL